MLRKQCSFSVTCMSRPELPYVMKIGISEGTLIHRAQSRTHCFSSMGTPGSGVTSDPVATMTFLVSMILVPPPVRVTSTLLGPTILPHPLTYSTYGTGMQSSVRLHVGEGSRWAFTSLREVPGCLQWGRLLEMQ